MKSEYLTINSLTKDQIIDLLANKAGITNCNVLTDSDFLLLRSGRMCESLLSTNFSKFIPDELKDKVDTKLCKVKLNYVASIDQVRPVIVRKYNQLRIPNSYMGYEFSNFELKELEEKNRLSSIVCLDIKNYKSEGIICVDRDLNMLKFLPIEKISINKSIGNNHLNDVQIKSLRKGYPVLIQNFERNDGRKFDAIIEINNDGLSRSKFAISGISQWLEEQKKQVARMNEIIDLQFDMYENKIKLKGLKRQ
jgi:hypothetical protein